MKRLFSGILAISLLLMSGCSLPKEEQDKPEQPAGTHQLPAETPDNRERIMAYVPEELPWPEWLVEFWGWDTFGDTIWLSGQSETGLAAASYDTISGQWNSYELNTAQAHNPKVVDISVVDEALWLLLEETYNEDDIKAGAQISDLNYYVMRMSFSGEMSCTPVHFLGDEVQEGGRPVICSLLGIDEQQAVLTTYEHNYLIDPAINIISEDSLPVLGPITTTRVDDQLYVSLDGGIELLDRGSIQLGPHISLQGAGHYSSNRGNFLYTEDGALYSSSKGTENKSRLFNWIDVALSYGGIGGNAVLENSQGDFFYPALSGLIKVSLKETLKKEALTLVCFGDESDEQYSYNSLSYSYSKELMDAIIRFNNTDPEYRIQVRPVTYGDENQRDRLLIELATTKDVDLIDTSILPEDAVQDGLLIDLLPYIDADPQLGRDAFIPSLLEAMMKNGGLYEYTDKFTMLTMIVPEDIFPGRAQWTAEKICSLAADSGYSIPCREDMTELFIRAATAEFINMDNDSCSFDSQAFINQLEFLKAQPEYLDGYDSPLLFYLSPDLALDAGYWARLVLGGNYAVAGLPETEGTGSYFMKLNGPFNTDSPTAGYNTRMGIMAASGKQEGAWRFLRTLILNDAQDKLSTGIPSIKERFEKAVDSALKDDSRKDIFNEADARMLREQVYSTTKLVYDDEALLNVIRSGMNTFFEGQQSAQEAARRIQSRVSIYLAEQYG